MKISLRGETFFFVMIIPLVSILHGRICSFTRNSTALFVLLLVSTFSDVLADLPSEALMASSLSQFSMHMKPYLWMQYPSATASEISSLVHSRWKALKSARREQAGEIGVYMYSTIDV